MDNPTEFMKSLSKKDRKWITDNADLVKLLDNGYYFAKIDWYDVYEHYKNLQTPLAIYLKGYMYHDGLGVKQDLKKAKSLYEMLIKSNEEINKNIVKRDLKILQFQETQ